MKLRKGKGTESSIQNYYSQETLVNFHNFLDWWSDTLSAMCRGSNCARKRKKRCAKIVSADEQKSNA